MSHLLAGFWEALVAAVDAGQVLGGIAEHIGRVIAPVPIPAEAQHPREGSLR